MKMKYHTRAFAIATVALAIPCTSSSLQANTAYWGYVAAAAGIAKDLWELGSSIVAKSSDYGIYSLGYRLERYSDLVDSFDHNSKSSVLRVHWRDKVDGSSKYLITSTDKYSTSTTSTAFEHLAGGSCTWTCSFLSDPALFAVSGRQVTVTATQYRVFAVLQKAPSSASKLINPIPATVVWNYRVPSATLCGTPVDIGNKYVDISANLSPDQSPLLSYPVVQGLSSSEPSLYLRALTDVK